MHCRGQAVGGCRLFRAAGPGQRFVPGEGGCWECLHDNALEPLLELGMDVDDGQPLGPVTRKAVGPVPAGISGYLAAHLVIALLTGIPPVRPGTTQVINLAALDAPYISVGPARPDCLASGDDVGTTQAFELFTWLLEQAAPLDSG
jgi:hypothetical protein